MLILIKNDTPESAIRSLVIIILVMTNPTESIVEYMG